MSTTTKKTTGITVYYWNGGPNHPDAEIERTVAIGEKGGDLLFGDGGHAPRAECYLTRYQCEMSRLLPEERRKLIKRLLRMEKGLYTLASHVVTFRDELGADVE